MKRLVVPFEIKSSNGSLIEGYGSTFGNIDLGGDIVMPGAFSKSLASGLIPKMLWNHDAHALPIGVWTEMKEDKKGLYMKGEFANTQMGNDVRTLAVLGAIDSMSIGYEAPTIGFDKEGNRLLKEIVLWEVSPVNFPMNPKAVIAAAKSQFSPRRLEQNFRNAGFSKSVARAKVHELFDGAKPFEQRCDADDMEVAALLALAEKFQVAALRPPNFR